MRLVVDAPAVIECCRELVATDSVNPALVDGAFGEAAIARVLADYCRAIGLEVRLAEVAPGRPNVVAVLRGSGDGPSLMLNGHTDTVGVEGMTIPPFDPRVVEGRLYGRGSFDMKGGLAAMWGAAKALVDAGCRLKGDLILAFVADEEHASLGTQRLLAEVSAGAAIVAEPTGLELCLAHKGFGWLEVETFGRAAHGSRPDLGVDAITRMGHFLVALEELEASLARRVHPLLGPASVHASTIRGGLGLSTYPDRCILQYERRTLPDETAGQVEAEAKAICDRLARRVPGFSASSRLTLFRPGLEADPESAVVRCLAESAAAVLGRVPGTVGTSAWLDSALLARAGAAVAVFGPGGGGAHAAEEYVRVEEVVACAAVFARTAAAYCGLAG